MFQSTGAHSRLEEDEDMDKYDYKDTRITDDLIHSKLRGINEGLRRAYTAAYEEARMSGDNTRLADVQNAMRQQIRDTYYNDYLKWIIRHGAEAHIYGRHEEYKSLLCAYESMTQDLHDALNALERLYTGFDSAEIVKPMQVSFSARVEAEERHLWMDTYHKTEDEYAEEMAKMVGHRPAPNQKGRKPEYTPTLPTANAESKWIMDTLDEFRKMVAIRNWNNHLRKGTVKGDYILYDGNVTDYIGSDLKDPWTNDYSREICYQYARWTNTADAARIYPDVATRQEKFENFCHSIHAIGRDVTSYPTNNNNQDNNKEDAA